MTPPKPGRYRHYKGREYEVLGTGRHSEDLQELVVYRALYDSPEFGPNPIWIRPLAMFLENVEVDGTLVPRFKLLD